MASWLETKMASGREHCSTLPTLQDPFRPLDGMGVGPLVWRLAPRCLDFQVAGFGGHWHDSSGCKLKLQIKSHKLGTKALPRNEETTGFVLTASFPHGDWDSIYMPPMGSLVNMGMLPTWEKVVTYLLKPPDFGNLRDSHKPSQLLLLNKTFGILSSTLFQAHQGIPEMWQVAQGCLCGLVGSPTKVAIYPTYTIWLQKVVVHACSNTMGLSSIKWWTTQTNLQTT